MIRWVVCTNDFPHVILPLGTTEHRAHELCKRMNEEDEVLAKKYQRGRIYYHAHGVRVLRRTEMIPLFYPREVRSGQIPTNP